MATDETLTGVERAQFVEVNIDREHDAQVKLFDVEKGFGWLRIRYVPSDISIHASTLKQAGIDPNNIKTGDELKVCLFPGRAEDRGLRRYSVSRVNSHTPYVHPYADEVKSE